MDYTTQQLYEYEMSCLFADYGKLDSSQTVYNEFYQVTIERTPGFTVLWDGEDSMTMLALYDWSTHIALDLSAGSDDFRHGENKFITESFFWFADEVIFVPQEVLECRE